MTAEGRAGSDDAAHDLSSALNAIALARWAYAIASLLALVVTNPADSTAALAISTALVMGNLVVLGGLRRPRRMRSLQRLAFASVMLDMTVAILWVILDGGGSNGQMYAALGVVGVEVAGLYRRTSTVAFLVAIMAVLGLTDTAANVLFGRRVDLPTTIIRVALLWSIVLMARALLPRAAQWRMGATGHDGATTRSVMESKFQEVLDGAPNAIIAAGDNGEVMMVNAAALRLFDHTRREMIGKPAGELVSGLYDDLPHGSGARYLTREVSSAGQDRVWRGTRRDGTEFPAEVSYSTLQVGQRVLVAAGVRDITDRIRAEEERDAYKAQLEEAQRLESLGRLAGGIAHDFNNMLNVILNYTDFVEEATNNDPAVRADLGEIRGAGRRAARLTQQLLRLAGREALISEPMDLAQVLASMDGRLKSMLGPRCSLAARIPPDLSRVSGDPTMIHEVVGILVDNSVQAMEAGGEITIQAIDVTITPETASQHPDLAPGKYVVVSVIDQGSGMDEATRSRALEPFFSTRTALGAGLGLPTAYGLARQSGGTLQIASSAGGGTTVDVYLPAADHLVSPQVPARDGQGAITPRMAATIASRPAEMIMVLDHDERSRSNAVKMLIRNGFDVIEARDGTEALRLAVEQQGRIRLVIIDRVLGSILETGLPGMIRSLLPDVRMILVSVSPREALASQHLDDPSLPFMDKDYSEARLVAAVREVLAGGAPVDEPLAPIFR